MKKTKISGGITEDGIVVGNVYDKYNTKNVIARKLVAGFDNAISELVDSVTPSSINEIGCGEGHWVLKWQSLGIDARGSDFSNKVISIACGNAKAHGLDGATLFSSKSIYDIDSSDNADLVVCCEVLEHLDEPEEALATLSKSAEKYVLLSVPRERLWSFLNLLRGKYISQLGNTPGHIQHWSKTSFIDLVSNYFDILEVRSPLPWTMVLCKKKVDPSAQ